MAKKKEDMGAFVTHEDCGKIRSNHTWKIIGILVMLILSAVGWCFSHVITQSETHAKTGSSIAVIETKMEAQEEDVRQILIEFRSMNKEISNMSKEMSSMSKDIHEMRVTR